MAGSRAETRSPLYKQNCEKHSPFHFHTHKRDKSKSNFELKNWIKRNYDDIMQNRAEKEEELANRPSYLNSETHFIPKISDHSNNLVESKGAVVHQSLFKEAQFRSEKIMSKYTIHFNLYRTNGGEN